MKRVAPACVAWLVAATSLAAAPPPPQDPAHLLPGADLEQAASFNASLAVHYLETNDVAAAREKIEKALRQNPKDPIVQAAAGLVFDRLQEPAKADQYLATAIRLAPNDPNMVNNYAVFLCRHGKTDKGMKLFEQAARNPAYSTPESAYTNAGVCARKAGDGKRADELLRKALAVNPSYPDALLQIADLSLEQDQLLPARAFVQRFLASSRATPDVLMLAVRIERRIGDRAAEREFANRIRAEFPDSAEAKALSEAGEPR
jgi:type IV pilus assembly protein PilF